MLGGDPLLPQPLCILFSFKPLQILLQLELPLPAHQVQHLEALIRPPYHLLSFLSSHFFFCCLTYARFGGLHLVVSLAAVSDRRRLVRMVAATEAAICRRRRRLHLVVHADVARLVTYGGHVRQAIILESRELPFISSVPSPVAFRIGQAEGLRLAAMHTQT